MVNSNSTVPGFRGSKDSGGRHRLSALLQSLAGGFIHHCTGDNIFLAGDKVGVPHYIFKNIGFAGYHILFAIDGGGGVDLRPVDSLALVVDVSVNCQFLTFLAQRFKNNGGLTRQQEASTVNSTVTVPVWLRRG